MKMDSAYNVRVDAATEMVAVFYEEAKTPGGAKAAVPSIQVIGPSVGEWKRIDLEMEWGLQAGTEKTGFDGRLESHVAMVGPVSPLVGDKVWIVGLPFGPRRPVSRFAFATWRTDRS